MRDTLPKKIRNNNECGIVNTDSNDGKGTHWVAYKKSNNQIIYFDSYGNLPPPPELVKYFYTNNNRNIKILYNYDNIQNVNSSRCGQHCLKFLYNDCL